MTDINLNKLQEVFRKVFSQPALIINPGTTANDIRMWDSLTHIELIAETEQQFGIEFSLDEVMAFNCVGDMMDCIAKKQSSGY